MIGFSTSKHIDKICLAVIALTLLLTILFIHGESFGISSGEKTMGYEKRLFNTSSVHKIDIVMDDWESFIQNCENEEYALCTVLIDGEKYSNIAIRAKGNTSLSSVRSMNSERYSFKLEFDHYDKNKSYYGLDKLSLNNLIQDNTMMKDYLVYQMMEEFGVDAPLSSYVYISVNGEDWGLYLAVEGIEDSFLQRNYGSSTGELYKPDSMSFGGGRGNGKGFDMGDLDIDFDSMPDMASMGKFSFTQETSEPSGTSFDSQSSTGSSRGNSRAMVQTSAENSSASSMPQMSGNGFNNSSIPQNQGMNMPQMPSRSFDSASMPQMPSEGFDSSSMPQAGGDFEAMNFGGMFGGGGFGGFGMGSDDVKLKYIDDNPSSYSNIFNNAKTKISEKDQARLISALKNLSEYKNLEDTLDMEEVLRYFVVHNFVVNGDSYTGSIIHNYYLHEKDGQLAMIPWDYNLAFGTFSGGSGSSSINSSIDSPVSGGSTDDRPMVGWIFSEEKYTEAYHKLFATFLEDWITNGKLEKLIQDTADMIRPYVEKDTTKFCTTEAFETGVDTISKFVSLRGEAVSRQLKGNFTAVDASGLNTSLMGSMGGSMGGFGGDRGENMSEDASFRPESKQESSSFNRSPRPSETDASNMFGGAMPGNRTNDMPTGEGNVSSRASMSPPNGNQFDFQNREGFSGMNSGNSEKTNWIWVGVSAALLVIGLFIAIRKKY